MTVAILVVATALVGLLDARRHPHNRGPNLTKKTTSDRSKIDTQNATELRYWTRALSVSKEDILAAVEKVGNSAATVRKELANARSVKS
jgi:hypothetical protein